MASAVRYHIYSVPTGFTNGSGSGFRILGSGKLVSASPSSPSTIITIPSAPEDSDLKLTVQGVYGDAVARTGHGFSWFSLFEPGVTPVMVQTEKAVEDYPRFMLSWTNEMSVIVRPGQRFAIIDTGFAVWQSGF